MLWKMFTFKYIYHFEELKISFERGPNHETYNLADNRSSSRSMVRDFKSNVSGDLDYMEHLQDLHKMSRDILYSLDDEGIFIDFCRFLHLCDLRCTRRIYNFQEKSRIKLIGGVMVMKQIWNQSNLSNHAMISISVDYETIEKVGPSELHQDVNYQSVIHSTKKRQLIECRPESETKQKEKVCRNFHGGTEMFQ